MYVAAMPVQVTHIVFFELQAVDDVGTRVRALLLVEISGRWVLCDEQEPLAVRRPLERFDTLFERGILYAPDYVVNAGGAIYVRIERTRPDATPEDLIAAAEIIETTMAEVIAESKRTNQPTHRVADQIADERVRKEKERKKKQK